MSTAGDVAVVDASAIVDVLQRQPRGPAVAKALRDRALHVPAHVDAEVLSALGRASRVGDVTDADVADQLSRLGRMPLVRHPLSPLLMGAWARRENLRLADALYVELAEQLGVPLVTTDRRLAAVVPRVELPGEQ